MFEKFSYTRKKSPFNDNTKTNEAKEGSSRLKKGRNLNLDEVVIAVTETPVGSPEEVDCRSSDSESTDDEDLLKPALGRTNTADNNEEKGTNKTRTDSKGASSESSLSVNVQKSDKESIHNGNFEKNSSALYVKLDDIFPNVKDEIKRRAVELSSNVDEAVEAVLAQKDAEENTGMNINL